MENSPHASLLLRVFALSLVTVSLCGSRFVASQQASDSGEAELVTSEWTFNGCCNLPLNSALRSTFAGNPYKVGSTVTPTTTSPEAETNIAINPVDLSTLIAVVTDYSLRPGNIATNGVTKFALSTDFGRSWTESFVPLANNAYAASSDGFSWLVDRDPGVAVDTLGNVFIAGLYLKFPGSEKNSIGHAVAPGGFYVCAGMLPSITLTAANCRPVYSDTAQNPTTTVDRAWLTVDNKSSMFSGNVYATWTQYTGCGTNSCQSKFIAFSRSTDHGITWSPLSQISAAAQAIVDWPMVTVGGDGTVYLAYEYFGQDNARQHWITKSTDGGVTFQAPLAMTQKFHDVVFNSPYRKNSAPNIVVSSVPGKEYLYDIYANQNGNYSDVVFVRSNQPKGVGGFTAPTALNDTPIAQRTFPASAVDANGTLHVTWLDTRNSPSRQAGYDVYGTYSKDLGVTFAPNARVTRAVINGDTDFLGDYFGLTVEPSRGIAHAVWSNGGDHGGHLQTATLTPQ